MPVVAAMSAYYEDAFLDPSEWRTGSYQRAFSLMYPARLADAQAQVPTITAGPNAGAVYSNIRPLPSTIEVKVLIDARGKPQTAVAIVDFQAIATQRLGGTHRIESTGQFFLEPASSLSTKPLPGPSPQPAAQPAQGAPSWMIIGWSLHRTDVSSTVASPSVPTGSRSP